MTATAAGSIAGYVTDMLALELHIREAIDGQLRDLADDPDSAPQLESIRDMCTAHAHALQALGDRREYGGPGVAGIVKKAAASVLGVGAAAIDLVRTEQVPKMLRDDYAAVSLATIGYVMLHTAALALDDTEVAELAQSHLEEHTKGLMTLHNMVPGAVVRFLQAEGLPAASRVLPAVSANLDAVWHAHVGVPSVGE